MPTRVRGPVHPARISSRQVDKRRESYVQHANVRSKKGKDSGRSSPGYVSRTLAGEQEQRKSLKNLLAIVLSARVCLFIVIEYRTCPRYSLLSIKYGFAVIWKMYEYLKRLFLRVIR